jgi:hypothetical protein
MKYSDMLNVINFNISDPWNYDFYRASIEPGTTDQIVADTICESIPSLRSIPFYVIHSMVYFVLPSRTEIPENMLNNIEQITEVTTEAEFLEANAAAEAAYLAEQELLAQAASETPTE